MTVCQQEELLEEVKQPRAKKIRVRKEISAENADILPNDVKVVKAYSVKMSDKPNFILTRFKKLVCALQALVYASVMQKVTLTKATATLRELLKSDGSINKSNYSVKISKLTEVVQRLTGLAEPKDWML